jgi:aspartate aminotransferase-like enzyme
VLRSEDAFLISSANKCIEGVPGFGFILARREALLAAKGRARTLSLDLPHGNGFRFEEFYSRLNELGFVIYPGNWARNHAFALGRSDGLG